MREILFRGQDAVTREWIYGCYVDNKDRGRCPPIIVPKNGDPHIYVIPETVGQYIGFKDKNGVMDFEGSLSFHNADGNGLMYETQFVNGRFLHIPVKGSRSNKWLGLDPWINNDYEIFGTIHDCKEKP